MRLGAMLVRDGRLTSAQVLEAVAQQAREGGRLGTVLIEMGMLDADTLTIYLGLEMGIPIATRGALDRAKRTALRVVPAETAERLSCLPLLIQDRQLIVAMRDPHDLMQLDELAQATGYRIIPRVAPEVRIHYYLERYYGIPRPMRFRILGEAAVTPAPAGPNLPEPPLPPLPGLPPPPANPPPQAIPTLLPAGSSDELVHDLEHAVDESTPPPVLMRRPHAGVDVEAMARAAVGGTPGDVAPPPVVPARLDLEDALLRITIASTRAEIADALLAYARTRVDVGVLLIVRDDLAFGWKGFGPDLDLERLETLLVPLETSSMFRAALDARDVFVTSPPASNLHRHVLKVLRAPTPARAVVAPVIVRDRAVILFYGQVNGDRTLSDEAVEGLRRVSQATANGYVRLIALLKHSA